MYVELYQWFVADALKAVNFSGLDHQNVTRTRVELLSLHGPAPAARLDELNFVVRMSMWPRSGSRNTVEEKDGDVDVCLVGANELVRTAFKWQRIMAKSKHSAML